MRGIDFESASTEQVETLSAETISRLSDYQLACCLDHRTLALGWPRDNRMPSNVEELGAEWRRRHPELNTSNQWARRAHNNAYALIGLAAGPGESGSAYRREDFRD